MAGTAPSTTAGTLHSSGDPVCGGVASGQWSVVSRMLSPWTLEDAQRPGEAGVGVRGKRGGHGGEEKDGETVRVVAGGWKGWAGLCRMRGYRSKYCWRVAAARRRRRHWLVTSQRLPRPGAVHCTAATCVPARTTHRRNPPPVFAHGGLAQLCAEYPRHEVLRAAAASLSPPGRCPLCLLETSCFYFVRESVKLLLRLCRNESYMNRDDVR